MTRSDVDVLATSIPAGSKNLLAIYKPNQKAQANLTPQEAAVIWGHLRDYSHSLLTARSL